MTSNRCADCIHFAPWPERVMFIRDYVKAVPEAVPEGYPLHACMRCPTKALAVAPDDGTECTHFERGDRDEYYKEV